MTGREPASSDRLRLDGRVAVVTGAARGLGRAYAVALASAGARVLVNDVDLDGADATVAAVTSAGGEAVAHAGAVGPATVADALVEAAVDAFGRIDVMCTNAGGLRDRVLWNMTDEEFDEVVVTHLRGTFTCARAAAIRMRAQGDGGRIIVVGSRAGQRGNFGQTNYAAAKAGIAAFARTWALELLRSRITVNAVIPTAWTAMTASIPAFAPIAELLRRGERLPAHVRQRHGIGLPEECAALVVFLASDAAADVTGQCIGLGGDRLALWSHPTEAATLMRDGGWSAEQIADAWNSELVRARQSYGLDFGGLELGGA